MRWARAVRERDRGRRPHIGRGIIPEERKGGGSGVTKVGARRFYDPHPGPQGRQEGGAMLREILHDAP